MRTRIEYSGRDVFLFSRYKGNGPLVQSLPSEEDYPSKILVTGMEKYTLMNFINDFNLYKGERYNNNRI